MGAGTVLSVRPTLIREFLQRLGETSMNLKYHQSTTVLLRRTIANDTESPV